MSASKQSQEQTVDISSRRFTSLKIKPRTLRACCVHRYDELRKSFRGMIRPRERVPIDQSLLWKEGNERLASCLRYITRRIENLTIARINFFKLISNRLWSILSFFKPLFSLMDWENALRNVLLFLLFLCLCLLLSSSLRRETSFSRDDEISTARRGRQVTRPVKSFAR